MARKPACDNCFFVFCSASSQGQLRVRNVVSIFIKYLS
ncbi:MAG: hypothetical protein HYZ21_11225 [Chloroflexi bacterium]|nr:hypothetical protein [Chloroflexota bacterium]